MKWRKCATIYIVVLVVLMIMDGITHLVFDRAITNYNVTLYLASGFIGVISAILSLKEEEMTE
jgi:uncharacterized membrane protein